MTRSLEQAFLLPQAVQTLLAFEGLRLCFLPSRGTWLLLKKQHSTDLYFRGAEAEWERETGTDMHVYLIRCVFLEYTLLSRSAAGERDVSAQDFCFFAN